jgi:Leucine-rich repeat (LRR) protein
MNRFLRCLIPPAMLVLAGLLVGGMVRKENAWAGQGEASRGESEKAAVAALTAMGVPVQLDPRGSARWIEASKKQLTSEAMRYLPDLPNLEWLEIGGGSISSAALANLKNCVSLKRLFIHDIDLGGEELPWLSALTKLEALSLQRTGLEGSVLDSVGADRSLKVLNLSKDNITDADLDRVAKYKELEVLALADTKITGAGIAKLQGMQKLNELNLINCNMRNVDPKYFVTMPNLRILYVHGSNLSIKAVFELKEEFPLLAVFR